MTCIGGGCDGFLIDGDAINSAGTIFDTTIAAAYVAFRMSGDLLNVTFTDVQTPP